MRQRSPSVIAVAAFALLLSSATIAVAHHGWGEYDSRKPLTLTGTIKTAGYENPHAFVDLDVDGKVWHAVLAPPSRMQARGIPREALKPDTTVTVTGFPHKSKSIEMKAENIKVGDKDTYIR